MYDPNDRQLFGRTLIVLAACIAAVFACYFWIDRPVAFFVERHQLNQFQIFRWLTVPPPIVQTWSPLILAVLVVRRAWRPFARWQKVLLVACLSLIVADQFRTSLGDACGRYWPETWFDNNPSLIGNGRYGFHPFVHGDDVGSFPSGHAARILGFAAVWWLAMPLCLMACCNWFTMLRALGVIRRPSVDGRECEATAVFTLSPTGSREITAREAREIMIVIANAGLDGNNESRVVA